MLFTWRWSPGDRPSFHNLHQSLLNIAAKYSHSDDGALEEDVFRLKELLFSESRSRPLSHASTSPVLGLHHRHEHRRRSVGRRSVGVNQTPHVVVSARERTRSPLTTSRSANDGFQSDSASLAIAATNNGELFVRIGNSPKRLINAKFVFAVIG